MDRATNATMVARFPEPGAARHALQSLSRAGVDGVEASLVGAAAARAEHDVEVRTAAVDRREGRFIFPRIAAGAVAGGVLAAIIAFLANTVAGERGVIPALFIGLIAVGTIVGGFVGGILNLPLNRDIDLTFASSWNGERPCVQVRVPAAERTRVRDLLEDLGAERIDDVR